MNLLAALLLSVSCSLLLAQVPPSPDLGKREVEFPTEVLIAKQTVAAPLSSEATLPGLVRWHPNVKAALEASAKSGKPVFRFQLLGRLDERFT